MYFQSPPLLPRWNAHNTIAWRTAPTLLGTLRSNDADGNENVIKTIRLISKTTTLHVHHTFLNISFPFLHDFDYDAFYGERKQNNDEILFLFLNLNMVPWNSALAGFAYNWQRKWVGIIAIKTGRRQIHFLSDVVVAVASLDLIIKVPIVPF